jgi:hypothetical protein
MGTTPEGLVARLVVGNGTEAHVQGARILHRVQGCRNGYIAGVVGMPAMVYISRREFGNTLMLQLAGAVVATFHTQGRIPQDELPADCSDRYDEYGQPDVIEPTQMPIDTGVSISCSIY